MEVVESKKVAQKIYNYTKKWLTGDAKTDGYLETLVKELKTLNKETVNGAIRAGWANAANYAPDNIKDADLFDPARIAASGTDIAAMFGQSGYGNTPASAAIQNINTMKKSFVRYS